MAPASGARRSPKRSRNAEGAVMLNLIDETLGDFSGGSVDLAPRRFGRVV